jgi:DNA-binding transcriptional LysR family regulator
MRASTPKLARGQTELLAQALRERRLDALVIDARSLKPATDLRVATLAEMRGAFLCRRGHPLARRRRPLAFDDVRRYPIASIPLSDEVARVLVERYGPAAHPNECVTLRCEEIASLVDVVRDSDAVLLAIRAAAPDLVELRLTPTFESTARFGLVTLAGRSEAPALPLVRKLIGQLLRD